MSDFFSLYSHDFARIACCVPRTRVADASFNLAETLRLAAEGDKAGAALMVFPELGLSSYAIEDLLLQDALLDEIERSVAEVVKASKKHNPVLIVGAPLRVRGRLYNTAIVIHRGAILGVVPKIYLPNYREFYEKRHFISGANVLEPEITLAGQKVPFGTDFLFRSTGSVPMTFHVEICEDVWVPVPPSSHAALAGAEVLVNLSASNITIGKAETRRLLCASQSSRAIAAYAYSAAGAGESTTDLAWDGHAAIFEIGDLLSESQRFAQELTIIQADIDLGRIRQERLRYNGFADCAANEGTRVTRFRTVTFELDAPKKGVKLQRAIERFPYVPSDPAKLRDNCYEAYNIQIQGLAQRLQSSRVGKAVIGVSGGLDSTHALLVTCRAMDLLGLDRKNVLAFTMPGFGTSDKTHKNAWRLMRELGVTAAEIDIKPSALQMLKDIGHPFGSGKKVYDVTFENVQAGLRTDYLFRLANQHGGMVVGTGDLSELGLGWCTYGVGDHMSHYNPNGSVSKTSDPAPDPFRCGLGRRRQGHGQDPSRYSQYGNLARIDPGRRKWRHPVDRAIGRSLCAAGLQPVLPDAVRLPAVQDRLPRVERLARRSQGGLASKSAGRREARLHLGRDQEVDDAFPAPFLHQSVQALGTAQWTQDFVGRLAVATRRLARAFRRQSRCMVG